MSDQHNKNIVRIRKHYNTMEILKTHEPMHIIILVFNRYTHLKTKKGLPLLGKRPKILMTHPVTTQIFFQSNAF